MTDASMRGFVFEMALIKKAQADIVGNEPAKQRWQDVVKTLAQNIGAGAVGYGLGTGAGYAAGEGLRRFTSLYEGLTPERLKVMRTSTGVMGSLGGIAALIALNKAQQRHKTNEQS